ncbi:major facilitator superfamily domain-containing protein [Aspergillus venezuelensis]
MGKIQLPAEPPVGEPSASASDDLELPSYDEVAHPPPPLHSQPNNPLSLPPDAYSISGGQKYQSIRDAARTGGVATFDPGFSTHATLLESLLTQQTRLPPRPCLVIHGSHKETRKSGNETKSENVTDFNFRIDLTRSILRWGRHEHMGPSERWAYTTIVSDGDGQKAYRGGRIKARAHNSGRIALDGEENERLMDEENGGQDYPGLKGWCERFIRDPAPVKSFTYRRHLHGFDANPMKAALTTHIRSTGYQGHISISPVIANGFVTFYSPHWINKARNNAWIFWPCIILQLWIITWPIIWFMERRYEVVRSEWFSSKNVADPSLPGGSAKIYAGGHDEATAAELWAPVVREAAWKGICHGEILGDAEIEEFKRQGVQRRETLGQAGELVSRGQAMLGAFGVRSIGGVNVSGGWGGDNSSSKQPSGKCRNVLIRAILWAPPHTRWNPDSPPKFNMALNLLFAFAGTFTVANLYYAQPLLDLLADYFGVTQERASLIPTCSQAGYAAGLIFICPMGDMVRRRPFVLLLTFVTATMWLGLCFTTSFNVFLAISFLSSFTTVTPQIMLPLVGDLAPASRRATALSIVSSGLVLGLLFARLLSGIIAQSSSWRNVYFLSLALQYLIFILLYAFMPDYPSTNKDISYFKILWSILGMFTKYPVLVQATLMGFLCSSTFTSFWTTLTFLLSGDPYHYDTLQIGLFSIAGLSPMIFNPIYSRYVIDKYVFQFSITVSLLTAMTGIALGAYTGTFTVAGPILHAALLDFGNQATMIANRSAIYAVNPKARNRVNTGYMVGCFVGQLMGTAVGNRVYAQRGWVISGSVSLGLEGGALVLGLLRGPMEKGWIGWRGGWFLRRVHSAAASLSPNADADAEGDLANAMNRHCQEEPIGIIPSAGQTESLLPFLMR